MLIEFVEGSDDRSPCCGKGPIPVPKAVDYIKQVLLALQYAHSHGVIHRDIKPANMMLTPAGVVKLMDFGIAKLSEDRRLTQTGRTVGSLYYMSPEQIQGAIDLDPRADLYSLGVSLYEMVTLHAAVPGRQRLLDHGGASELAAGAPDPDRSDAAVGVERHHSDGDRQGRGSSIPNRRRVSQGAGERRGSVPKRGQYHQGDRQARGLPERQLR